MSSNKSGLVIDVAFRENEAEDISFIYSSWLKSYRSNEDCKRMNNTIYFNNEKKKIEKVLQKSDILMAVNPEDPTQIYGYIVFTKVDDYLILHWVYVKYTYRKLDIGNKLLKAATGSSKTDVVFCTYANHAFDDLKDKFNLIYNPYLNK